MTNIADAIKQTALGAVASTMPSGVYFGTVTSVSPVKVQLESKITLDAKHLILTTLVQDFDVDMTVDHMTEEKAGGQGDAMYESHAHAYTGRKTFTVHLGLKSGEKVMLIRVQGGQRYIILDRVR